MKTKAPKLHIWDRGYRLDELGSGNYEDEFLVVSGKNLDPVAIVANGEIASYVVHGKELAERLENLMYSFKAVDEDFDLKQVYIEAQDVLKKVRAA